MVRKPEDDLGLSLTYGGNDTYNGLDRFGRVKDQLWQQVGQNFSISPFAPSFLMVTLGIETDNMNHILHFKVLEDYVVHVVMSAPDGYAGEIRHVFPTMNGTGVQRPVGFFMAFMAEPSEIRPPHWEVQLFLRADIRYDPLHKKTETVASHDKDSTMAYHPDLPRSLGNMLIERGYCREPIALSVSLFRNTAFVEFGKTWVEDE